MNYVQIGLIITASCFVLSIVGCFTLNVDLIYYSMVGMLVTGFAVLAIYANTNHNYDQRLKIQELNTKLDLLKNQLNKRSAI